MFTDDEFEAWCDKLCLPYKAYARIKGVRSSEPARRVRSRRANVSGRYPSRKMGRTIQFESHRNELATILELEHDAEVFEYYDQPPPIKLIYQSSKGKRLGVIHTPDYFVIRAEGAYWLECKTEEELRQLTARQPEWPNQVLCASRKSSKALRIPPGRGDQQDPS